VEVDGRQRDPVLGQSTACQDALVWKGTREERPRRPGRLAMIPVACSDGQPWTWSWSLCCLRPEDAGTYQGGEETSRSIGRKYRVYTFCGLDSVLREMQMDARYCSRGWRVGSVSPRSHPTDSWPTTANPLMTCADQAAWERNAANMSLLFCRETLGPGVRFSSAPIQ
jgi:hypothetical protein